MNEGNVRELCRLFKGVRIKVHDEQRIGHVFGHGLFERKCESRISGNTWEMLADQSLRNDQKTKDLRMVQ
jgi:hypothetical protein